MRMLGFLLPLPLAASLLALTMAGSLPNALAAAPVANAVAPPVAFSACAACHNSDPSALGPDLTGISGRKAAALPGFHYSPAMRRSGIVWDASSLKRYLLDPQGTVPGNRMPMGAMAEPEADDVVAYLLTLK
jgi:cytochrome c